MPTYTATFQSPSGDSLFSDELIKRELLVCEAVYRFNPLAGIRCFLTGAASAMPGLRYTTCFNPLAGIRCFLTIQASRFSDRGRREVSIP